MRFHDKTVLVTGGASGIGLATRHEFARAGAHVILTDVDTAGGRCAVEMMEAHNMRVRFLDWT